MGKGGFHPGGPLRHFSWEEIRKHRTKEDRWIVIDNVVYNVSHWCKNHPGGDKLLAHYSGEDATVC